MALLPHTCCACRYATPFPYQLNNWFVTWNAVISVTSRWASLYFICFYIITIFMMMNLVVSFVIEAMEFAVASNKVEDARVGGKYDYGCRLCRLCCLVAVPCGLRLGHADTMALVFAPSHTPPHLCATPPPGGRRVDDEDALEENLLEVMLEGEFGEEAHA